MNWSKFAARWASCMLFAGILATAPGCGGGGGDTPPATPVAPTITTQPTATQTVTAGTSVSFTVAATGTPAPTYQWKKGGTAVATGGTAATYTIATPTVSDAGTYTVTVTNSAGNITSNPAVLNVLPAATAPSIDVQPTPSTTVLEGGSATLSVSASTADGGILSYQWKRGTTNVGTNSASLSLNPVALADAGTYTVVVTNTLNGTTAQTTSNAAVLTVNALPGIPTISVHPLTQSITEGNNLTLSVTATASNGTLSYQWKKGAANVGTNSPSLVFTPVALADAGTYTVVVTNTLNGTTAQTTSDSAVVTVTPLPAPVIDVQPQSKTVVAPSGTTFSVTAHGTGTLRYQWKKNGSNVGTDSASYAIEATDLNETTGLYSVVVTDSNNATVTSENATLTVTAPEPTYAGDPVAVPSRPLTVRPSYHVAPAFPNGSFRFGYDETLKNPVWTAYANFRFVTKMTVDTNSRTFLADDRLAMPRVMDNDFNYAATTMTRGHQVPMSNLGTRYGQQAADDTCYMSNIAPQVDTHNNNIWNSFEQMVDGPTSSLAMTFGRTWIYTGPTFDATPTRITGVDSTASIAIPSGFYKIIVRETAPGVPRALAILTPHQPTPATANLWQYVTSIARIETLAKLDFFPSLPGNSTEIATFKNTVDVTGWGTPFEKTTGPNVHMVEPSWDISVSAGTTVNFVGAGSSSTSTVSNPTWTFGSDGTATGYTTTHTFNTAGSYSVVFAVTDSASTPVTNTITRVVTVTGGNAAPTIAAIGAQSAVLTNPINVAFTVNDDTTPKNSLVVTATSNNQAVLQDASIVVTPADATTGNGNLRLTGTGTIGSATVTVRVTDGDSASSTTTFTFTVSDGNATPVITGLSGKTTPVDTPLTVDFTVSDTETAAGSLTVTAASSDTTLIPGTLTVTNTAGACSLTLTPGTGLSGSATITITVTDGGGKSTQGTFGLTVGTASPAVLIISQYYEGTSNNKWLEITNVGGSTYDASVSPVYLGQWNNPRTSTTNIYRVMQVPGTLAPGASKLLRHTQAAAPAYALTFGDVVVDPNSASATGVVSFNGNDIMYLTPLNDATAAGYDARTDVIGDVATWHPATGTPMGENTAWVRGVTTKTPNATFTVGEWAQVLYTDVDAATSGTNVLGIHVYNP